MYDEFNTLLILIISPDSFVGRRDIYGVSVANYLLIC